MTPHVVADVGNTRIKWGRCAPDAVLEAVSLPPDDPAAWQAQADDWSLSSSATWAIAGVHPARRTRLAAWIRRRGDNVAVLADWKSLPLAIAVPKPESVGIDRLLDAVAANALRDSERPAIVVDAGSAVTVDWIDETGAFQGGAILPGFALMAKALHDYTALLPLIETPRRLPELPGRETLPALEAGVFWAVAGGVQAVVAEYVEKSERLPHVFLTGGDAALLHDTVFHHAQLCPLLTIDGIRRSARS
jgi:type III pantothenate kinase